MNHNSFLCKTNKWRREREIENKMTYFKSIYCKLYGSISFWCSILQKTTSMLRVRYIICRYFFGRIIYLDLNKTSVYRRVNTSNGGTRFAIFLIMKASPGWKPRMLEGHTLESAQPITMNCFWTCKFYMEMISCITVWNSAEKHVFQQYTKLKTAETFQSIKNKIGINCM